jgi:hypothetical protein
MTHDQDWRLLAEQASKEQDPAKLLQIIKALTAALDRKGQEYVR